ncbi:ran-binding protein 1 homolog b [Amborella trichopoda]|uniref:RanBD1 domain-containing protein n=1 Tax=Amborella trichopoda TaxID=13333 RepID=W1NXA2_AMBTC|nr:ran-binding protein 1 homolog b [Amborella trichopoda]ERN02232.1 hypothetical protein AMTR_s00045p00221580 [Amborella trichopoda]|eukprot:XP_006840557.1 ran-binding protein 1 homolog b [Amborella trichopoda]
MGGGSTNPEDVEAREHEDEGANAGAEEEDTGAQVAPIVKLEEVAVSTGEEHEEVLLELKAKLYRFDKDGNQWKERGVGTVKLLKHTDTRKVRLIMRQAKTLKICANHLVLPSTSVQEHAGNDKSCVWHATDFSDGELKEELFCIRFGSVENCKKFMEMVEEIAESQSKKGEEATEEVTSAAEQLESLSVGNKKEEAKDAEKSEEKGEKTEPTKLETEKKEEKPTDGA